MPVSVRSSQATFVSGIDEPEESYPAVMPPDIANGDTLISVVWQDTDGDIALLQAPAGWSQVGADITASGNAPHGKVFVRSNATSALEGTDVDWPISFGSSTVFLILAVAEIDLTTPSRVAPLPGTDAPPSIPSGSGQQVGDLVVWSTGYFDASNAGPFSPDDGFEYATFHEEAATTWCGAFIASALITASGNASGTQSGTGAVPSLLFVTDNPPSTDDYRTVSFVLRQGVTAPSADTTRFFFAGV